MNTIKPKLVRDKIPHIIGASGKTVTVEVYERRSGQFIDALRDKLTEERAELEAELVEGDPVAIGEEIADMVEVLYALAGEYGISERKVGLLREKKASSNGKFDHRYKLTGVE